MKPRYDAGFREATMSGHSRSIRNLCLALAGLAGLAVATPASAAMIYDPATRERIQMGDPGSIAAPPIPRQIVSYSGNHAPGTIVVSTAERRLYLVLQDGKAMRYAVGVGRPGFEWGGVKTVTRKAEWPAWTPPPQMLKRRPDLPRHMVGGPDNPLGARALYLGSSFYRIHGSNEPGTIGQAVSSGCIRMHNDDVVDLYERVRTGTRVVVMR
jgi:lipoprotein-anchoring transpeptidase ErfK/SrfK